MIQGDRLRLIRQRRQWSQTRLGQCIDQDGQYISKLERGLLPGVTTGTLVRLCRVLGVSADYLLGLTDDLDEDARAA